MSRIGRLDQRITFQDVTLTPDGAGGQEQVWTDLEKVPTVWAQMLPGGGGERFEEQRMSAQHQVTFRIRSRDDLSERMRVVWNGETYDIRSLPDRGTRDRYMRVIAERGVTG